MPSWCATMACASRGGIGRTAVIFRTRSESCCLLQDFFATSASRRLGTLALALALAMAIFRPRLIGISPSPTLRLPCAVKQNARRARLDSQDRRDLGRRHTDRVEQQHSV